MILFIKCRKYFYRLLNVTHSNCERKIILSNTDITLIYLLKTKFKIIDIDYLA